MSRILITGCSGFLASHLLPLLLAGKDNQIFGITEVAGFTHAQMTVHTCDIRDGKKLESIVAEVKPELVFHLAAVTNVGFSWKYPRETYEINFLGSGNLFDALMHAAPKARVVVMSSAEIYDRFDRPIAESAAISCRNPYSLSKRAMEMLATMTTESFGLPAIIVRSFNFTGPGQEGRFVAADFAAQIAEIEKGRHEAVLRVGNLQAVRDFSDVRDVARYLAVLAKKGISGEIYNLCSGRGYAIRQILEMLLSFSAQKIRVEVDPEKFRPLDMPIMIGDPARIHTRFGLYPEYTIEQTLTDLLNDCRSRA